MKFIYPAVFRKTDDGRYQAFFPDLACCEADSFLGHTFSTKLLLFLFPYKTRYSLLWS